jgi:hypothetical protein
LDCAERNEGQFEIRNDAIMIESSPRSWRTM